MTKGQGDVDHKALPISRLYGQTGLVGIQVLESGFDTVDADAGVLQHVLDIADPFAVVGNLQQQIIARAFGRDGDDSPHRRW